MRTTLHIFQHYLTAIDYATEYAKKNDLKLKIPDLSIMEGDERLLFVVIKTKEDALRLGGLAVEALIFHDDYQDVIDEDAYEFLLTRVRKIDNEL